MIDKIPEKEKQELNYNYFYEDLVLYINKLIIININSDILMKIINKILSKSEGNIIISENCVKLINKEILLILNLLSKSKNILSENELHKLINFSRYYSKFLQNFIQQYESDIIIEYKYISKIFSKFLEMDISNNYEKYKVINSSSTISFLEKLQEIQSYIKTKINEDEYHLIYNKDIIQTLITINKIYNKYQLSDEDESEIFALLQFELENNIPKFILYFSNDELSQLFEVLLDFVNSINPNIRRLSQNLLLDFKKLNLINFQNKQKNGKDINTESNINLKED
jgi:hypothetical protein